MKIIKTNQNDALRILVTFGSSKSWGNASKRLARQAVNSGKFDQIIVFNEEDVYSLDPDFRKFSRNNPRGFGLWKWKPLILKETLLMFPTATCIIYLDAGCEINCSETALMKLDSYFSITEALGALGFELPLYEVDWTHPELVKLFDVSDDARQIAGGIIFLKNNLTSFKILEEWESWMSKENSKFLKGDFVGAIFPEKFKEHRYDQSVLSLIWKNHNLPVIPDETYWGPNWRINGREYPIWATRNRMSISYNSNPFVLTVGKVILKISSKIKTIR